VKAPVRLGASLAFRTAFVVVYARIAYRLLHGGPIGWGAVLIYAAPGVAAAWGLVDSLRYQRLVSKEVKAKIAYIAAGEAEKAAALLRVAADELRVQALERTADNTERTAIATEAIAEQGKQNGVVLGDLMLNIEISPEVRFQAAELLTRLDREARSEAMAREAQEKFGAGQFPPPPPFG
jgi:hypothetical protein